MERAAATSGELRCVSGPAFVAFLGVCLLRVITLDFPALLDPTEGRYAFIAQQMNVDRNWLTPHVSLAGEVVPYLGKPPLHFWLTAGSFSLFGFDEWSARVPSFLSFVFLCWCVWHVARLFFTREAGLVGTLVFSSTVLGFFCGGASIVDFTLAACVGGALTAFAQITARRDSSGNFWPGMLFFVAAALGFMTKGPVALVLIAIPVAGSSVASRNWVPLRTLPWVAGLAAFFMLTWPWFYLSERANPGFTRYFFLQENVGRFLFSNYGDKYGTGHQQPYGMIWVLYTLGCLPWAPLVLCEVFVRRRARVLLPMTSRSAFTFVCLWAVAPLVVFTFARQLLVTYAIPGLAGFSLVAGSVLSNTDASLGLKRWLKVGVYLAPSIGLLVAAAYFALGYDPRVSPVSLVPAASLLAIPVLLRRHSEASQTNLVAAFAACFVSLFAFALILLEAPISQHFSAKPILQCLTRYSPSSLSAVGVLSSRSNSSSYFYGRVDSATDDRSLSIVPVNSFSLEAAVPKDMIVSRQVGAAKSEPIPDNYSLVLSLGAWSWVSTDNIRIRREACLAGEEGRASGAL